MSTSEGDECTNVGGGLGGELVNPILNFVSGLFTDLSAEELPLYERTGPVFSLCSVRVFLLTLAGMSSKKK